MRIKGLFWILTALLLSVLAIITYHAFYTESVSLFFLVEGLVLLTVLYLSVFYRRIIKPLHIIGNGMELLKEQDFSSRLSRVGQKEADRIVDIFNKMMEQLKNERLHLREQNHFLDLLINASPMGVIMLNLDKEVLSVNPAARKMLGISSLPDIVGKRLSELDSPLAAELEPIPLYDSQTVRLNDANIYKCTHSSFVDRGFHHSFYLVEMLTQEVFKAEKKAYEKVIRMIAHEVNNTTAGITSTLDTLEATFSGMQDTEDICEVLTRFDRALLQYEPFYHEFCRCGPHTGAANQDTAAECSCLFLQTFYGNDLSEPEYPDRDGAGLRLADCQSGQFTLRTGIGQHHQERLRGDRPRWRDLYPYLLVIRFAWRLPTLVKALTRKRRPSCSALSFPPNAAVRASA